MKRLFHLNQLVEMLLISIIMLAVTITIQQNYQEGPAYDDGEDCWCYTETLYPYDCPGIYTCCF